MMHIIMICSQPQVEDDIISGQGVTSIYVELLLVNFGLVSSRPEEDSYVISSMVTRDAGLDAHT